MLAQAVIVIALSPVFCLVLLLLVLKWPLKIAAPLTFLFTTIVARHFWETPWSALLGAVTKGVLLTGDIALIVFGAVLFLNHLRESGTLTSLQNSLKSLSPDRRIQAILLAWFFGGFIEGVAGFGTPAVTVAPLLVGLGFSPLTAISSALLANSTAVVFGAVGTPIRIGFAGLDTQGVTLNAALLSGPSGILVPVMILGLVVWTDGSFINRGKAFRQGLPWALFSGFAFLIPFILFAIAGPEFPSLFGAAIGMGIAIVSLRFGFLVPPLGQAGFVRSIVDWRSLASAFFPYALLMGILLAGKFIFSSSALHLDLGNGLSHSVQIFNPGFAFLTVILLLSIYSRRSLKAVAQRARFTFVPIAKATIAIFSISSMTYVMIVSGTIDRLASAVVSPALPLYAAFIGAFGAFLTGSATVSNLLLGELQARTAENLGLAKSLILALQLIGAAAGNMIALPNLLAAQAALQIEGKESHLIFRLMGPCLIYLFIVSILAMWIA